MPYAYPRQDMSTDARLAGHVLDRRDTVVEGDGRRAQSHFEARELSAVPRRAGPVELGAAEQHRTDEMDARPDGTRSSGRRRRRNCRTGGRSIDVRS